MAKAVTGKMDSQTSFSVLAKPVKGQRKLKTIKEHLYKAGPLPRSFSQEHIMNKPISQQCGSCYTVTTAQVLMARARLQLNK
jgi:hypothetical protein